MVSAPLWSTLCPHIWISKSAGRAISITTTMSGASPTIELEEGLLAEARKDKSHRYAGEFPAGCGDFEKTRFSATEVKSRLHETAYLNPELTIVFEDKRGDEPESITFHEPEGIVGFIKDLNKRKQVIHEPVYFKGESEGITVEVAFQYINEFRENVLGFCNNIYNGGRHPSGRF